MGTDLTPVMGDEERRRAEGLSRQRRRPPTAVPGYEPERFLGHGAFGEVWVAVHRNSGRRVAIKFYAARGGLDWSLLSREVEKLRFLFNDRYVAQLLEVGWDADPPFYVMEYLENGSLEDRLRGGPLPAAEAVGLWREAAQGLAHAHNKGILHCDLKPANVLLDHDGRARLADFGQARLSDDHSPALGTLFYMAPEQADLKATPDARWDVYALGALLYCMLTGRPPFRGAPGAEAVGKADKLEERLAHYRRFVRAAPRPSAHRRLPDVDRRLADILDRCLEADPRKRFPNVQAVHAALDERAMCRARRPLLVLGAAGPAALLLVMAALGYGGFRVAVGESTDSLVRRTLENNRFSAQFVAESVGRQIDQRWRILEQAADDDELRARLKAANGRGPGSPEWRAVQERLDWLRQHNDSAARAYFWWADDAAGNEVALSPLERDSREGTVGRNYAYRDYFHGLGEDKAEGERPPPLRGPHRSAVYLSKATHAWMVAFSVPVRGGEEKDNDEVVGVLALAIRLGDFEVRPGGAADGEDGKSWALIDGNRDQSGAPGLVLQHPDLEARRSGPGDVPEYRWPPEEVARLRELVELKKAHRPLEDRGLFDAHEDPVGGDYAGRWLAAAEPVVVPGREGKLRDTGWVVVVQQRHDDAVGPVDGLKRKLMGLGLTALALVVGVVTALWAFVLWVLSDAPRSRLAAALRRRAGLRTESPSGGGSLPRSERLSEVASAR